MIKKAYAINMSYEVTDAEKQRAERALLCFNHTIKLLGLSNDHLNIMKTPFKENPEMSVADVMKARVSIRRFRDKSVENFNEFKQSAFKCVNAMNPFSSDTQTVKLMKSFITSIDDLENKVNKFVELFNDLESKDFSKNIVASIEGVQSQCDEIEEITDDRVKNHIQTNILAKSWVDSISNDLQMKVEQKTPLILDLFNRRQDALNETLKDRSQ
jgi:hypothetical protein